MTSPSDVEARIASQDSFWLRIILIVSALLCAAVLFLIYGPRPEPGGGVDVSALPTVNASLNLATSCLLLVGYALIRRRRVQQHKRVMLAAFGCSAAFLASYVIYHSQKAGPALYTGAYRGLYLAILVSHIVLAAAILPLALLTLQRGWAMRRDKHRKIARVTLPLWLYVSVTGVVIYAMLYL
jgi:putative membrane protein